MCFPQSTREEQGWFRVGVTCHLMPLAKPFVRQGWWKLQTTTVLEIWLRRCVRKTWFGTVVWCRTEFQAGFDRAQVTSIQKQTWKGDRTRARTRKRTRKRERERARERAATATGNLANLRNFVRIDLTHSHCGFKTWVLAKVCRSLQKFAMIRKRYENDIL